MTSGPSTAVTQWGHWPIKECRRSWPWPFAGRSYQAFCLFFPIRTLLAQVRNSPLLTNTQNRKDLKESSNPLVFKVVTFFVLFCSILIKESFSPIKTYPKKKKMEFKTEAFWMYLVLKGEASSPPAAVTYLSSQLKVQESVFLS